MKRCLRCEARYDGTGWRCPACGAEPATAAGFPAFAPELMASGEGYDPAFHDALAALEARNFWFRARNRLITWALGRYFGGLRRFFEVGCGTGFVLQGVAAAFPAAELTASEAHASGLAHAARRVPRARLLQMDARRVPFESEFDVVGAFDVIEHIEDDRAVLRELHRAAVPGGGLVLTVPQHPLLWSRFDVSARHVRRYRAAELREKVAAAGFEILKTVSFVSLLLPLLLLSRLSRRGASAGGDPLAELRIAGWRNAVLERVLDVERALIRAGLPFPAGGSLLLVARKKTPHSPAAGGAAGATA